MKYPHALYKFHHHSEPDSDQNRLEQSTVEVTVEMRWLMIRGIFVKLFVEVFELMVETPVVWKHSERDNLGVVSPVPMTDHWNFDQHFLELDIFLKAHYVVANMGLLFAQNLSTRSKQKLSLSFLPTRKKTRSISTKRFRIVVYECVWTYEVNTYD